ncbi:hypothetical protein SUGI_1374020 [Cryptomeria japonica]|uniref:Uncharacterized protein n=1 Tax=Cryptomeria japonica TaxID=3369 RepID=A0AAD3NQA5_CRYJA|nr:hypothetical protein SUGI_1374020 [Cryptomeria japonica]
MALNTDTSCSGDPAVRRIGRLGTEQRNGSMDEYLPMTITMDRIKKARKIGQIDPVWTYRVHPGGGRFTRWKIVGSRQPRWGAPTYIAGGAHYSKGGWLVGSAGSIHPFSSSVGSSHPSIPRNCVELIRSIYPLLPTCRE